MKIAIVHDWITQFSGAEKVLKELHLLYPNAPIYTLDFNEDLKKALIPNAKVIAIKPKGLLGRLFRNRFNSIIPSLIESIDLTDFDIVISSSPIFSKAIITRPQAKHICYCYSPSRQLWDNRVGGYISHIARIWDRVASVRPDQFVAISKHIQDRIKKYYRRDSIVIYPPVDDIEIETKNLDLMNWRDSYYLIVSRLIKSKNIELAIKSFEKMNKKLVIIGEGPLLNKLKSSKNVTILGYVSDTKLREFYRSAKAFVMPQKEDFGIATVEAMKYGKPVIALKSGSALELIDESVNGVFFNDPIVESLGLAINKMEENYLHFNGSKIRDSANQYSTLRFREEFNKLIV